MRRRSTLCSIESSFDRHIARHAATAIGVVALLAGSGVVHASAANDVVEFYSVSLNHYYITLSASEGAAFDAGSPPGWSRTGKSFPGYLSNIGAPADAVPVYRFYCGTPCGGSYFYTAFESDKATLVALNPGNDPNVGAALQGVAFYTPPTLSGTYNGGCAVGQLPVTRYYNNQPANGNHRFSTDPGVAAAMTSAGWINEGVVFCAYDVPTAAAAAMLMPGRVDFGTQVVGVSGREQVVTLRNTWLQPLAINSVTVSPPFTLIHNCPALLPVNQGCGIAVAWTPGTTGAGAANLSVSATVGTQAVSDAVSVTGYAINFAAPAGVGAVLPSELNAGFGTGDFGSITYPAQDRAKADAGEGADCDERPGRGANVEEVGTGLTWVTVISTDRGTGQTGTVIIGDVRDANTGEVRLLAPPPSTSQHPPPDPTPPDPVGPPEPGDGGDAGGGTRRPSEDDETFADDPVNTATGGETLAQLDFTDRGAFALQFSRTYNSVPYPSNAFVTQPVGRQWRSNMDLRVVVSLSGADVDAYRADGKRYRFARQGTGEWLAQRGVVGTLRSLQSAAGIFSGWQYTTRDGIVEQYDVDGRLLEIRGRGSERHTLKYDPNGRLLSARDQFGREMSFSYDAQSRVSTLTDPSGRLWRYDYDAAGNLSRVHFPDGGTREYRYEDSRFPFALTGIINAIGERISTLRYDAQGRVEQTAGAGNLHVTRFQYNQDGTTDTTDAVGNQRRRTFSNASGSLRVNSSQVVCATCAPTPVRANRDADGSYTSVTNALGVTTRYQYNALGLPVARTEADGTGLARTTRYIRDAGDPRRLARIERPDGSQMRYYYDAQGRLVRREQLGSDGIANRSLLLAYDSNDRVASSEISGGSVTARLSYEYTTEGWRSKLTNAVGHEERREHDAQGRIKRVTGANGNVTAYEYSAAGRVTQISSVDGTETADYDATGRLRWRQATDGTRYDFGYDTALRLDRISDSRGNQVRLTRDAFGRLTEIDVRGSAGSFLRRLFDFDANGQLVATRTPTATTAQYGYGAVGKLTSQKDGLSRETITRYDALNRPVEITDPLGNTVKMDYDAVDRLTQFTDARGNPTKFGYGPLGDALSETSPECGTLTRTVNNAGLTDTANDGRGAAVSESRFRYDASGRITGVTWRDRTGSSWTYDTSANANTTNAQWSVGQLTKVNDPTGSTTYEYDSNRRLSKKTVIIQQKPFVFGYAYDSIGRLSEMTLPSGSKVDNTYAAATGSPSDTPEQMSQRARLTGITLNGGALLSHITYNAAGSIAGWTYGGSSSTQTYQRTFDSDGRLASHSLPFLSGTGSGTNPDLGSGSTTLGSRTVGYDAAGQIVSLTDSDGGKQTFGYDSAGRLTSFTATGGLFGNLPGLPTTQSFTYDAAGNRTSQTSSGDPMVLNNGNTTYVIASNSNRLQSITRPGISAPQTSKLVYDAAGNIIHDGKRQYSYDARNRMATSRADETEAVYGYNASGQRTIKSNGAMSEWSVYDSSGRLANLQRSTESTQQEFIYLGLAPVAMIETAQTCTNTATTNPNPSPNPASCATPKITNLWPDHLGTPRRATDATTNQMVWSWESAPFGEMPAQSDPRNTGTSTNITLRFPGQQYDPDTNLHYNQQRDYNPATGRYVQADPIGLSGGANLYGYVGAAPTASVDANGLITAYCTRMQSSFIPHGGIRTNGVSRGFYPADAGSTTGNIVQSLLGGTVGTLGAWVNERDPFSDSDCTDVDVPAGCDADKFDACILAATKLGTVGLYQAFLASCHNRAGQVISACVAAACTE